MKILKFYADWCAPCRSLSDTIESVRDQIALAVDEINIDTNSEVAAHYNVRAVPTMIVVDDGDTEIRRHCGHLTAAELLRFVQV
jgi:thioredoxin 1